MDKTFYLSHSNGDATVISRQFRDLISALEKKGLKFKNTFPSKYLISLNHNPRLYREFTKYGGKPEDAALVLLEPYTVFPSQYSRRILNKYRVVHSPGNPSFSDYFGQFVPWPYELLANPSRPSNGNASLRNKIKEIESTGLIDYDNWIKRKQYLTLINSNKVSPVKSENYGLRRIYARLLPANTLNVYGDLWISSILSKILHRMKVLLFTLKNGHLPNLCSIYGNLHWKFDSAKGLLEDKQVTLQSSKFSIVIENDSSYISEKLIDVLINGCIPIYFGPRDIDLIIPRGTYLELPIIPSQLIQMLTNLSEGEIQKLLRNIYKFVTSQEFTKKWDKKSVFDQLAISIVHKFGGIYG